MKVTKKTRLLAKLKRVALFSGWCDQRGVTFKIENPEGIRGYRADETSKEFSVDLYRNGALVLADATARCEGGTAAPFVETEDFATKGDTVKVVAHIDPAKTDFDQRDAELEFEVTA